MATAPQTETVQLSTQKNNEIATETLPVDPEKTENQKLADAMTLSAPLSSLDQSPSPQNEKKVSSSGAKKKKLPSNTKPAWEHEYRSYFSQMFSAAKVKKTIQLMRSLEENHNFFIRSDQTLFYKDKNLGNIFVLMFVLFADSRSEQRIANKLTKLRKALKEEHINL